MRGSVIEDNDDTGVIVVGSDATLEDSSVRGTAATPSDPYSGMGVVARNKYTIGERAVVSLTSSVVSDNVSISLYALGADASVSGSVIRDTQPAAVMSEEGGRGIGAEADPLSNQPSTLSVSGSLIDHHHDTGIFGGSSDVVVDGTVVSNIESAADGRFGRGINIQLDAQLQHLPATATVTRSRIESTHEGGMVVLAAALTMKEAPASAGSSNRSFPRTR